MSSKLGDLRRPGRDRFAFVARKPWVFHQNEIAASDVKVEIVVFVRQRHCPSTPSTTKHPTKATPQPDRRLDHAHHRHIAASLTPSCALIRPALPSTRLDLSKLDII